MSTKFPAEGMALTNILVVDDINAARDFYVETLGASLYREYGGTSVVVQFLGAWILLVTGGGPTADKPDVHFVAPENVNRVQHAMTIRVPDCRAAHKILSDRGARFLTDPVESEHEVRAFFRDPAGHLLEISEFKG